MAEKNERDLFVKSILPAFGNCSDRLNNLRITGFLAMKGNLYDLDHELMVVGRAVNGWTEGILISELNSHYLIEKYANIVFQSVSHNRCPMSWVTDRWGNDHAYNTKRSAFWRVVRAVVDNLHIANITEGNWPSHIVWSNLYKVAPAEGGNPSDTICKIQFRGCRSLLGLELTNYSPKRLLFLTGLDWAKPFLENICHLTKTGKTFSEAVGEFKHDNQTTKVVIAGHPQGKPEDEWVQEVTEAFYA